MDDALVLWAEGGGSNFLRTCNVTCDKKRYHDNDVEDRKRQTKVLQQLLKGGSNRLSIILDTSLKKGRYV
jgi:hypothetical protein